MGSGIRFGAARLSGALRSRKQNLKHYQAVLRSFGCDIARAPLAALKFKDYRRVPLDLELFREVYAEFTDGVVGDFARCQLLVTQTRRIIRDEVPGDLAEVGVYQGRTARIFQRCCEDRILHLFDTFQGQPANVSLERDGQDYADMLEEIRLDDTSQEAVNRRLESAANLRFHPGYFPDTAKGLEDASFALVHLDGDQYQTTADGCEFFYPPLSGGGALICHDYGIYEGVRSAMDEYVASQGVVLIEYPDATGSALVIKP